MKTEAELSALQSHPVTSTGPSSRLPAGIALLTALPAGERRLGPFDLVDQLGRGGFAPVWLAREVYGRTTLRTAAVKLFALPRVGAAAERERTRIIEEARALCRVEHPNIVRFYALPIDEERGVMGLAMEHVDGTPLDRQLEAAGTLPVAETLAAAAAVASALAAVHRAGLIHRDVKPSNVIQSVSGYKLIDFGIAGLSTDDEPAPGQLDDGLAQTQRVAVLAGTVGYMDPECVAHHTPADATSDLYALGATLFECLTARLPGIDGGRVHADVLDGRRAAPRLAALVPAAPPALADLVDSLLAPQRSERPKSAEWVAIRLEQIRRELGGAPRQLPPERVGPFRGLGRFESDDRDLYFGRSSEVAAAVETLRGRGLVALLGPSGSGKSSLARAGLLPAVADGALGEWPRTWDISVSTPGTDPRATLLAGLPESLQPAAEAGARSLALAMAERAASEQRGLVVFVDQLEELATLSDPLSAGFVVELLREIGARPLPGVRAVVAARRDLLDPLLAISELGKVLLRGSVLVEPLTHSVWSDVIDRSLGAYGYSFEDAALHDTVIAELSRTSDAMPLVQFALTELWNRRDTKTRQLTRSGLAAMGGIEGALGRHADATLDQLLADPAIPPGAPRALLLGLTTARGTRATRTLAELERLVGEAADAIVDALEAGRLVVRQSNGVTLAHDTLISTWGRLRDWLAEERDHRLFAEELERAARAFSADPATPLWRRQRLEDAERVVRTGVLAFSDEVGAFLSASRRAERNRTLAAAGVVALVLGAAGAVTGAYLKAVGAEQKKTTNALASALESREKAERRTQEVQAAQARIDQLLKDLAESPKKDEIQALQRRILAGTGGPAAEPAIRRRTPSVERHAPAPVVAPPPVAAPPATPPPSTLKVQSEW